MLSVEHLVKIYAHGARAVDDISFALSRGVVGLIGHNGAGKTTLIDMLCTLTRPTSGRILLDGVDIVAHPDVMRRRLGVLPQHLGASTAMRVRDFMLFLAALKGVRDPARIDRCLAMVNLHDCGKRRVDTLSGGMLRRLGIAQALLADPDVLILDEPTTGLDIDERTRFRALVSRLGADRLVLISTHIVSDIEHIADELLLMRRGTLLSHVTPQQAMDAAGTRVLEDALAHALGEEHACVP